jgi:putative transposase
LAFPPEIRRIVYTTHAVESLQRILRKVMNTRGSFPHEEAAMKWLPLALGHVSNSWGVLPNWKEALNRFAMLWGSASHSMLFTRKYQETPCA